MEPETSLSNPEVCFRTLKEVDVSSFQDLVVYQCSAGDSLLLWMFLIKVTDSSKCAVVQSALGGSMQELLGEASWLVLCRRSDEMTIIIHPDLKI